MIKKLLKLFKKEEMKPFPPLLAKPYSKEEMDKANAVPVQISAKIRGSNKKIKIAIDESVGVAMAKRIKSKGYEIVCKAGNAEPDDVWMKRALAAGAMFIVSPDLDIPSMIERENYPMVWIDFLFASQLDPDINTRAREVKRDLWAKYVCDRIQAKLKFFYKEFGGG